MSMVATIASDADAVDTRIKLNQHRDRVSMLRGQLDQLDAELSDVLVAEALGQTGLESRIDDLGAQKAELQREIDLLLRVVGGLDDRLRTWQADERRRRYERDAAELCQIEASAPALEGAAHAAATAFVEAAADLLKAQARFDQLHQGVLNYRHERGLSAGGFRRPAPPVEIPVFFTKFPAPLVPWGQWLKEWRERHR